MIQGNDLAACPTPRSRPCGACGVTVDVFGNGGGKYPTAYSEDVINGEAVYYCRDCTLKAYAFCETVWVTRAPAAPE